MLDRISKGAVERSPKLFARAPFLKLNNHLSVTLRFAEQLQSDGV